ncbi:hypothetical protein HYT56_05195 [Candidatus Woesearchaeota archaeon]|nr:hypothetical protein [Candidatus Woesearchaeota archaeon]
MNRSYGTPKQENGTNHYELRQRLFSQFYELTGSLDYSTLSLEILSKISSLTISQSRGIDNLDSLKKANQNFQERLDELKIKLGGKYE